MGAISKNCSSGWQRRVRDGHWATTGFLRALGRRSFLQKRFRRLIPTGSGSICERCSFGFRKIIRESAPPTFVGWRGFLGAMTRRQPANGRWSSAPRNHGYRPKGENRRDRETATRWRSQTWHRLLLRRSTTQAWHGALTPRNRAGIWAWRGDRKRSLARVLP